ncbi:tyrosine-type recombinase/integrase [Actinoplanes sp. GCM10030250]|uniref:tyrosine-type recombinase/integrase n=1 Tax=Actinoplanes sp. GCM10030250 TaxID=3273376 RepID=UPI00361AB58B
MVAMLGLLGLRIFEACGANIADLGEEHGHRVLKVRGKGGKVVLVPLPPVVARAIDRAVDERDDGPILRNARGARMDRHAATRRLKHLDQTADLRIPKMHPHMLRHTFVILDNLTAHNGKATRAWEDRNRVELCFTPIYAAWANPIEARFRPLRTFVIAGSDRSNHPALLRHLHNYLRWRNANARHPEGLAAQRRERARIRSERQRRWGQSATLAA